MHADTKVADIHVWRVGPHHLSVILSLVTRDPKSPDYYKTLLADFGEIAHATVEVNAFEEKPSLLKPESMP